jgi:hypothetical protein
MDAMTKAITILGAIAGLVLLGYGLWLWGYNDFPTNALIPYKNTFATNPIHTAYIGVLILSGSIIQGALRYGWFNPKS